MWPDTHSYTFLQHQEDHAWTSLSSSALIRGPRQSFLPRAWPREATRWDAPALDVGLSLPKVDSLSSGLVLDPRAVVWAVPVLPGWPGQGFSEGSLNVATSCKLPFVLGPSERGGQACLHCLGQDDETAANASHRQRLMSLRGHTVPQPKPQGLEATPGRPDNEGKPRAYPGLSGKATESGLLQWTGQAPGEEGAWPGGLAAEGDRPGTRRGRGMARGPGCRGLCFLPCSEGGVFAGF